MEAAHSQVGILIRPVPGQVENRVWVEHPGSRALLSREGVFLALASIAILISFLMSTLQSHGLWISIPCWFSKVTGLPCLTCGMTRSFALTAHGQWLDAFRMHLLGPVLFILLCAFAVYMLASLVSGIRVKLQLNRITRRTVFWSVVGIFFISWVLKLSFFRGTW